MALADLNRAQDTPVATFKLSTITPEVFPTLPAVMPSTDRADVPVVSFTGGVIGEDPGLPVEGNVPFSTANATNDYTPRSQFEKTEAGGVYEGNEGVVDVGRDRGWIAPRDPYSAKPVSPDDDPVVTSIAPSTAAASVLPIMVTITGENFTPFSKVYTGGANLPDQSAVYVSPTEMQVPIWAAEAGTVSVAVEDHSVMSNTDVDFTVT